MRGEYCASENVICAVPGSPPLARGILVFIAYEFQCIRITPACAGNTKITFWFAVTVWDHPRLRGEYSIVRSIARKNKGSPPLARGIRRVEALKLICLGITPACAGNTFWSQGDPGCTWDHPRLRGEYQKMQIQTFRYTGSPPLARGIRLWIRRKEGGQGITPACAGNTYFL